MAAQRYYWIPDEQDGYILGEVHQEDANNVTVLVLGNQRVLKRADCFDVNPKKFDKVADMSQLGHLSDATVLYNLKERYFSNKIYTYSGLFCVALNPYKNLPIYTRELIELYKGKRRVELEPHVFAVADEAYRAMIDNRQNQSMLITGESGAGKTVNTKKVIQYLAYIAGRTTADGKRGELEEQLVQANPILESFGNAKTIRNDNSSRFGKFIEIQFTGAGLISGGVIDVYLLEKSRVVYQAENERNFHVFYHLVKGAPAEVKRALSLTTCEDYAWLRPGSYDIREVDDTEGYNEVCQAWAAFEIPMEVQMQCYRLVAGILHLGNVHFQDARRGDETTIDAKSAEALATAEGLFGIAAGELGKAVMRPRLKAGLSEWVNKSRNAAQAKYVVEALAKHTYERLFRWIVSQLNLSLENKTKRELFIGVLDIAGFEIFQLNSFEQLCINYTNEKLQQFFNNHMFKLEQEEYMREQIQWTMENFGNDLQPTVDLIESTTVHRFGVLSILDEQCSFPKATDTTFVEKLAEIHQDKSEKFSLPKFDKTKFSISHYAGVVEYDTTDWLEKNRDKLDDPLAVVVQDSRDPFVASLFVDLDPPREGADSAAGAGRGNKKKAVRPYVSQAHKNQLTALMDTLYATSPHFIRCIKPNEQKRSGFIEAHMVLEQLRCNGVLEGIRICRKGYPNRLSFQDFRDRYKVLSRGQVTDAMLDAKAATNKILEVVGMGAEFFRIGVSKVFFKAGKLPELEELRDEVLGELLIAFQAVIRGHLARARFNVTLENSKAICILQKSIQMYLRLRHWGWWQVISKVRPMLEHKSMEDEVAAREAELAARQAELEAAATREAALKSSMETAKAEHEREKARAAAEAKAAAAAAALEEQRKAAELQAERERIARAAEDSKRAAAEERKAMEAAMRHKEELLNAANEEERRKVEARIKQEKEKAEAEKAAERERAAAEVARKDAEMAAATAAHDNEAKKLKAQMDAIKKERAEEEERRRRVSDEKSSLESRLARLQEDLERESAAKIKADAEARRLAGEISSLKEDLATATAERAAIESAKRDIETKAASLATDVSTLEENVARLEKAKRTASGDSEAAAAERDEFERKWQAADRDLKKAKASLEEAAAEVEAEKAKAAAADKKLRKTQSELKAAQSAAGSGSGIGSTSDAEVRRMEAEIRSLKEQLTTSEAKGASLERQRKSLQSASEDLQDQLNDELAAKADAGRKLKAATDAAREAEETAEEERAGRESAELLLHQRELELEDARRQAAQSTADRESSVNSNASKWQATLDGVRAELDNELRNKASMEAALRRSKDELAAARADADDAKRRSSKGSVQQSAYEAEIASLKGRLADAERALAQEVANGAKNIDRMNGFRDEADEAVRAMRVAETQAKSLSLELQDLRADSESAASSAKNHARLLREAEDETRKLQGDLEDAELKADLLREEQARLLEEIELMRGSVDSDALARVDELEKSVRELTNSVHEAKESADDEHRKALSVERAKRALQIDLDEALDALESERLNTQLLSEAKGALEADLRALRAQLSTEQNALMEAHTRLRRLDDIQAEAASQLAEVSARRDAEVRARKELGLHLKEAQAELDNQKQLLAHVERSKRLKEEEYTQLKDELEDALEERRKVEERARELYAELQEFRNAANGSASMREITLEDEKRELARELEELKLKTMDLERRAGSSSGGAGASAGEVKALKAALVDEQAKTRKATKLAKSLKSEVTKTNGKLEAATKAQGDLKRELAVEKTQAADGKARFELLERKAINMESSNRNLEDQLQMLRDALDEGQKSREQQQTKRRELEAELQELHQSRDRGTDNSEAIASIKRQHLFEVAEMRKKMMDEHRVDLEEAEGKRRSQHEKLLALKEVCDEAERELDSMKVQLKNATDDATKARARLDAEVRSLSEIEKSNRQLSTENKDLSHKLKDTERYLATAREEKDAAQSGFAKLQGERNELAIKANEADSQAKNLAAELETLRAEKEDALAAAADAEAQASNYQQELEELTDRVREEEEARDDWQKEKGSLADELAELKSRFESEITEKAEEMEESRRKLLAQAKDAEERRQSAETAKLDTEMRFRRLENEHRDLIDEVDKLRRKQGDHEKKVSELQAQVVTERTKYDEETRRRVELSNANKVLENQEKELREAVADVTKQLGTAQAKRTKAEEGEQRLKIDLEELQAAFKSLEQTARELESEIEELRERLDNSEAQNRSIEEVQALLGAEVEGLEQELMRSDETVVRLEKETAAKDVRTKELMARLERAEGRDRSSATRAGARLDAKVKDTSARLDKEQKAKIELQKENRQLTKACAQSAADAKEAMKVAERDGRQLAKANARIDALRVEYDTLASEKAMVESDGRRAARELQEAKEKEMQMGATIAALTEKVDDLKRANEETRARIAALRGFDE